MTCDLINPSGTNGIVVTGVADLYLVVDEVMTPTTTGLGTTGGNPPYTYCVYTDNLPSGLILNTGTGAISGTPVSMGGGTIQFLAKDSIGAANLTGVLINISNILTADNTQDYVAVFENKQLIYPLYYSGGRPPHTWSIKAGGVVPSGSVINGDFLSGNQVSGVGTYQSRFNVVDANNTTGTSVTISFEVLESDLTIGTPEHVFGATYNTNTNRAVSRTGITPSVIGTIDVPVYVSGGSPPYYYYINSGSLPDGLSLTSGGLITGIPTTLAQEETIHIDVVDSIFTTGVASGIQFIVNDEVYLNNSLTGISVSEGSNTIYTVVATGGSEPFSWYVTSGNLPSGMILSSDGSRNAVFFGSAIAGGYDGIVDIVVTDVNGSTDMLTSFNFDLIFGVAPS